MATQNEKIKPSPTQYRQGFQKDLRGSKLTNLGTTVRTQAFKLEQGLAVAGNTLDNLVGLNRNGVEAGHAMAVDLREEPHVHDGARNRAEAEVPSLSPRKRYTP